MSDSEDIKPSQDVKPDVNRKIRLTVHTSDGSSFQFIIKATNKLGKIFDALEEKRGVAKGSLRFLHNGTRLRPEDTPVDHDMEDDDEITAELMQIGGNRV